ncbi:MULTISPECIES: O-antigen ligase family protein [Anaerolinea]|uniref:Hypothetical membrane protein n=1 Tax=Anaerolinea thermophila (strain DSM 14523 / JCM 11388 / NBRC 100420 / UNI-1) TaxID=926569 RepID=E8N088_ANATU|nr:MULTISPECIES: O-antigen ligase family protein [Anaerolinea]BAJ64637.1 hypothetical membrane protein [Anaerolinea thermophila UNI-1]
MSPINPFILILWLFLHLLLGILFSQYPALSTLHAITTLVIGTLVVLGRNYRRVLYVAAYITGAEVLWRMTGANVFWEYGKYATVFLLGLALMRLPRWRGVRMPLLYFSLLLPSIILTVLDLGLTEKARSAISFNLSGPLALAICALFFFQVRLSGEERKTILWVTIAPLLAVLAVILRTIRSVGIVAFTDESNFVTSGGFGPNQVSALVGLGALLCILLFISTRRLGERWIAGVLALTFLIFSVLTFSRGGVYNVAGALILALPSMLANPRLRNALILFLLIGLMVASLWAVPFLDSFTQGMVRVRYANLETTNRLEIMQAQLQVWGEHPLLGVGPGMAKYASLQLLGYDVAAHTEYTRVLAEHGFFGVLALLVLLSMAVQAWGRAQTPLQKTLTTALLAWPLLEMSHAAMRVVAIAFIFGLALAGWAENRHNSIQKTGNQTR